MLGFEISRVLVIAPLRVAQTGWTGECKKWDHLKGLRISRVLGSAEERREGLRADADVYVINRENVAWLVDELWPDWPFDMVVIDELSSFKSPRSVRFRALRKVRPRINRIVGLTGTPAPNGLIDLWPQMFLIDKGKALGRTLGTYRDAYFRPGRRNGMVIYDWVLREGAEEEIYRNLQDSAVSMKAVDYIKMPERIDNVVRVQLPDHAMKAYLEMQQTMILQLIEDEKSRGQQACACEGEGVTITATSAATVSNKLLQICNGAVYDDEKGWTALHDAKLDALEDLIEGANGNPVLVFYSYKFDCDRILERFPQGRKLQTERDIEDWNEGKIPLLCCHPDSAGHGLNLQTGGHIMVWFGLTWSLEKYQQACARLHRQGQQETVIIHHIIAEGTMDEVVMQALERKEKGQNALFEALKAKINEYEKTSLH